MRAGNPGSARGTRRLAIVVVAVLGLLAAGPVAGARADLGFQDQSFSGASTPTGTKRAESVLWFNDGSWSAVMWDVLSQDFHIFRLDAGTQKWVDTGVRVDTRSNTQSDVLWDGSKLYVASHRVAAVLRLVLRRDHDAQIDPASVPAAALAPVGVAPLPPAVLGRIHRRIVYQH